MVSLVNAARLSMGRTALGFINPSIYKNYSYFANDITSGNNKCAAGDDMYSAGTCCSEGFYTAEGWDPVTGFGSVDFTGFYTLFLDLGYTPSPTSAPSAMPSTGSGTSTSSDSKKSTLNTTQVIILCVVGGFLVACMLPFACIYWYMGEKRHRDRDGNYGSGLRMRSRSSRHRDMQSDFPIEVEAVQVSSSTSYDANNCSSTDGLLPSAPPLPRDGLPVVAYAVPTVAHTRLQKVGNTRRSTLTAQQVSFASPTLSGSSSPSPSPTSRHRQQEHYTHSWTGQSPGYDPNEVIDLESDATAEADRLNIDYSVIPSQSFDAVDL
jgi:hypothetical protein